MDLAVRHPKRLKCGAVEEDIQRIEQGVVEIFEEIIPSLKVSDKEAARRLIDSHWWIVKRCDEIVDQLVEKEDPALTSGDAVSTALYARYLKRVGAHLMNIASSIVNPFEKIGFRTEDDALKLT